MNVYTPDRYDERVVHLALGIEPRDAVSQQRLVSTIDVRPEEFQRPVGEWRAWRPGETLTGVLPRMHRHRSGRFVRRYDERVTARELRIVDDQKSGRLRLSGAGRRIVPRRIQVTLVDSTVVLDAEADPNIAAVPAWQRTYPIACFPGSAAELPSQSTVLRGRIVRVVDGRPVSVRWPRVQAENDAGDDVGWAHGDDRGEFVLVLEPSLNDIGVVADPARVTVTVGATLPPLDPDPADPLLATVDPLWDLPVEAITASDTPLQEPSISGRSFLPEHDTFSPMAPNQTIDLPHGRETSVDIRIA